jgi:hypothetical protein
VSRDVDDAREPLMGPQGPAAARSRLQSLSGARSFRQQTLSLREAVPGQSPRGQARWSPADPDHSQDVILEMPGFGAASQADSQVHLPDMTDGLHSP